MKTYASPSFGDLPGDVQQLFQQAGHRSFFSTLGWYDLVARFGMHPGWRPHLITDDRAGAAFVLETPASAPPRELASLINPYSCEHAIITQDGGGANNSVSDLVGELARSEPKNFRIRLAGLDPTDATFAATRTALRAAGFAVRPFFGWGNWFEATSSQSFDEYLAARPSVLVSTWKRKLASLQKKSATEFRVYEPSQDAEPFLDAYAQVEAQSWKRSEPFPEFVPELIRHAASIGALQFGVLNIEGEPAAAQFWILWQHKALIFKLVYATKFQSFSPGTLLTMHMIRHLLENCDVSEIDFGRGDDDYKKLWCSSRRERWGLDAANTRTVRGALLAAHITAGSMRDRYFPKPSRSTSPTS